MKRRSPIATAVFSRFAQAGTAMFLLAAGAAILRGGDDAQAHGDHGGDAASILQAVIKAHGGMEAWASAPAVSFVERWEPPTAPGSTGAKVVVEQGSRRAYVEYFGLEATMAWDGERAWSHNWTEPHPPRFLIGLTYYFLNLPWLMMDPGVVLAIPERKTLWDDPKEYIAIKVTFEAEVGDTPKDYYILYIEPETHRLMGCEYIVTYKALLPEGVESTPPNILLYDSFETVEGLLVPTGFTIYKADHSVYASCKISDWSFEEAFDASRLVMPEGGKVDTSTP